MDVHGLLMSILDTKGEIASIPSLMLSTSMGKKVLTERSMEREQFNIKQIIFLCLFPSEEKFCHTLGPSDLE